MVAALGVVAAFTGAYAAISVAVVYLMAALSPTNQVAIIVPLYNPFFATVIPVI